jgi:uncharacterized protein YqgC (DUF456 family)
MIAIDLIILTVVVVIALIMVLIGLPGTFLAWLSFLIMGLAGGLREIGIYDLGLLLLAVLAAEFVEFLSGIAGAKRFGSSRSGILGAFAGGFLFALLFTALLPLIGTFAGMLFGTFFGAFAGDYFERHDLHEAFLSAVGAVLGKVFSVILKVAVVLGSAAYVFMEMRV